MFLYIWYFFAQISAWVFLIHLFFYAGFYCSAFPEGFRLIHVWLYSIAEKEDTKKSKNWWVVLNLEWLKPDWRIQEKSGNQFGYNLYGTVNN